jgi:lipopolysaccharide/colanic/teichoic acid biosynthesis glycosyltransferase
MMNTSVEHGAVKRSYLQSRRPGESASTVGASFLLGGLTSTGLLLSMWLYSGDNRSWLQFTGALWAGVVAATAAIVWRTFEHHTGRPIAQRVYEICGAFVAFLALAAAPTAAMVGATSAWMSVGVASAGFLIAGRFRAIHDRIRPSRITDPDARLPVSKVDIDDWILEVQVHSTWARIAHKSVDLVLGMSLMLISLPVMLVVALAVKADSRGPVLYRQVRVGEGGKEFQLRKFRSMRIDAENDGVPRWSHAGDPRVTRVGRILRRWRLDELPQLLDVLIGRMSLVGPRPERPEFVEILRREYPSYDLRHLVRPGLTGWAQVRHSYTASTEGAGHKLEYDLYYVAHRSVVFDLKILADTAPAVLFGRGSE